MLYCLGALLLWQASHLNDFDPQGCWRHRIVVFLRWSPSLWAAESYLAAESYFLMFFVAESCSILI